MSTTSKYDRLYYDMPRSHRIIVGRTRKFILPVFVKGTIEKIVLRDAHGKVISTTDPCQANFEDMEKIAAAVNAEATEDLLETLPFQMR